MVPGLQALSSGRGRGSRCRWCHASCRRCRNTARVEGHRRPSSSRLSVAGRSGAALHPHAVGMGRGECLCRAWRAAPRARPGEGCGRRCSDAPVRRFLCVSVTATDLRHGFNTRPTAPRSSCVALACFLLGGSRGGPGRRRQCLTRRLAQARVRRASAACLARPASRARAARLLGHLAHAARRCLGRRRSAGARLTARPACGAAAAFFARHRHC